MPVNRTSWGADPAGWTNVFGAQMLNSFACTNDDAAWFNQTNARRTVFFSGAASQLVFKLKKDGIMGMSQITVEESPDNSTWSLIRVYEGQLGGVPVTDCADIIENLSFSTRYVRWTFLKGSGNILLDDVNITAAPVTGIWSNAITDANPSAANPFIAGQIVDANLTVGGIFRSAGLNANAGANRFNANGWTMAAAIDLTEYFEFSINPLAGYKVNFLSFVYTGQRSSTGPQNFAIRSSLDGFASDIGVATTTGTTIDLSGAAYQNITTNIVFRYYGWFSGGGSGTYSIDDFTFNGAVVSTGSITTGAVTGAPFTLATCSSTASGTVAFTSSGTFNAGNNFTAQLSDNTGSFAAPVSIGTLAGNGVNPSGTINITIPANTNGGTGYRIRVVGSNPGVTGSQSSPFTVNAGYCVSAPSDYFRTNVASGNWNTAATWQTSQTGGAPWIASSLVPGSAATNVEVRIGHTVIINTPVTLKATHVYGGLQLLCGAPNSGAITFANDASQYELTIYSGANLNVIAVNPAAYATTLTYSANSNINVLSGGTIIIGDGAAGHTGSAYFAFATEPGSRVKWQDSSILDWSSTGVNSPSLGSGNVYFPDAAANERPRLRFSRTSGGTLGTTSACTINGILEITAPTTLTGNGLKLIRDGLTGSSTLTLNNAGTFNNYQISSPTAVIAGTLSVVMNSDVTLSNGVTIPSWSDINVSGTRSFLKSGGSFKVDGIITLNSVPITNVGGDVTVNGTLRTAHASGLYNPGTIPSGTLNLNTATSTIHYNATANQVATGGLTYYNLIFSNSGTKTLSSVITANGTVTITGTPVVDATNHVLGGPAGLVMNGGRLIVGTINTQPAMTGAYNITAGVVEFKGSNVTSQTIRSVNYFNVEVTGTNVGNSLGNITLLNNGSFTVKPSGIFTINDNTITGLPGVQTVSVENGGRFRSGNNQGFHGYVATLTDNSSVHPEIENITLATGSIVEYMRAGDQPITNSNGLQYGTLILSGSGTRTAPASTLIIRGNLSATNPIFAHNNGTVQFSGVATQNYSAIAPGLTFYDLLNSNTVALNLNSPLKIFNALTFSGANPRLHLNNTITLMSDGSRTARVGVIPAAGTVTYGTGRFIVERYIPLHAKAWQFLATPLQPEQTINAAWQEGNVPLANSNAGYGTIITGNNTINGFDITTPTPSMKTYDPVGNSWIGVPNTTTQQITNPRGYMLFVRGDRSVQTYNGAPTETRLRITGKIYANGADVPPVTNIQADMFESIGNPYASAIDLTMLDISASVQDIFYVWDPTLTTAPSVWGLGAFRTLTRNGSTYDVTPPGGNYGATKKYIESGQAFFAHAVGVPGTVTFEEDDKSDQQAGMANRLENYVDPQRLYTGLYVKVNGSATMIDGVQTQFDASYSNNINKEDAIKMNNTGENLGIRSSGSILAVERRRHPLHNDTIFYSLGQLRLQQYQLEFRPHHLDIGNLKAYLHDRYLMTVTEVSMNDTSRIDFKITDDPRSSASDRFFVIFKRSLKPVVPVIVHSGVTLLQNPVTGKEVRLGFSGKSEGKWHYELINSLGQLHVTGLFSVNASGTTAIPAHAEPGTYLLKLQSPDGKNYAYQVVFQ